ncbi:MAG TPA: dihydropteroate synthase [Candidatus Limnocylindrales bacterium]|nr:dihydropteroate synthase [Candidatus Limnocylindrales bacterium]
MDATPSVGLPPNAESGMPARPPAPMAIGRRMFEWGARTFVMGIINVTPDSFSGDGLLARGGDPIAVAVAQAQRMAAEGADLLDVGGQSTRPGHQPVATTEELARVVPVVRAIRAALPDMPLSIDTTSAQVAQAAADAGADLVNDVWGTAAEPELLALAAERELPIVLMHNRPEARYRNVVAEVLADLSRALDVALAAGIAWERLIVDPGIGFGKTPAHNLAVLGELQLLAALGRPVLLGASRKSTIGKVLDLPAAERLEGTLATTALAVRAGVDIVRVHDVQANVRAARMADAIVRGGWHETGEVE